MTLSRRDSTPRGGAHSRLALILCLVVTVLGGCSSPAPTFPVSQLPTSIATLSFQLGSDIAAGTGRSTKWFSNHSSSLGDVQQRYTDDLKAQGFSVTQTERGLLAEKPHVEGTKLRVRF